MDEQTETVAETTALRNYSLSITIFFPKDFALDSGFLSIPMIPAKAHSPQEAVGNLARDMARTGPRWFEEFANRNYWILDSELLKKCIIQVVATQDFTKGSTEKIV